MMRLSCLTCSGPDDVSDKPNRLCRAPTLPSGAIQCCILLGEMLFRCLPKRRTDLRIIDRWHSCAGSTRRGRAKPSQGSDTRVSATMREEIIPSSSSRFKLLLESSFVLEAMSQYPRHTGTGRTSFLCHDQSGDRYYIMLYGNTYKGPHYSSSLHGGDIDYRDCRIDVEISTYRLTGFKLVDLFRISCWESNSKWVIFRVA